MGRIDTGAIAREIKVAQDTCTQVAPFTSRMAEFALSDAYDVLDLVHAARLAEGDKPVGRKIGFTNSNLWPVYDVHAPVWGYVYDRTLIGTGLRIAECAMAGLAQPRIEPEIVFRLSASPRADMSLDALLDCIEWAAFGFEVVQTHFPDWKFKGPDTVADNGVHGRLAIGEPVPVGALGRDPLSALESVRLTLFRDGREVEKGGGSNVLGSPLKALAHLVRLPAGQGGRVPLRAGEVVTTGTLTMPHLVAQAESWSVRLDGLPLEAMTLRFT